LKTTAFETLCLARSLCNRYKSTFVSDVDPETDSLIHLQDETRESRTLCDIETNGTWGVQIHPNLDIMGCKRCLKNI
jgi:hypothetical protein